MNSSPNNVHPHPCIEGLPQSTHYRVSVNGVAVATYEVRINPFPNAPITALKVPPAQILATDAPAAMASFDFEGRAVVEIVPTRPIRGVVVRPLSREVTPTFDGRAVRFEIDRPGQLVIEFDGLKTLPLFVFANAPETAAPSPDDAKVRYFGPGDHRVGRIELGSGETLYLAAGALVRGYIVAQDASDVRICGRGVLYGGDHTWHEMQVQKQKFVSLYRCERVRVEGITVLDGFGWNFALFGCRDVHFENVKIIGWRRNTDGIDPVSSENVSIRGCFVKVQDDAVSIKGSARHGDSIANIEVSGSVFWANYMRNIVVGGEMSGIRHMENIVIRDNDILESSMHPGHDRDAALSIWNVDAATIRNVLFEDIRVEHCHRLIRIGIVANQHSSDASRGRIENITFRNIHSVGGPSIVEITGHSAAADVKNVRLENVTVHGRPMVNLGGFFYITNEYVSDVVFSDGQQDRAHEPEQGLL